MFLAHRIRLDPTPAQRDYSARAAGSARRVWNWVLAEWNRQVAAGLKPNAMALKRQFNGIKYSDPNRQDAHAQPFVNLAKAWTRYFEQCRAGRPASTSSTFQKEGALSRCVLRRER